MDEALMLVILKKDLQMLTNASDDYLKTLLELAGENIKLEGITLDDGVQCGMVRVHYAAYLFRRRAGTDTTMPRFLRYELNNILLSQKGGSYGP